MTSQNASQAEKGSVRKAQGNAATCSRATTFSKRLPSKKQKREVSAIHRLTTHLLTGQPALPPSLPLIASHLNIASHTSRRKSQQPKAAVRLAAEMLLPRIA